MAGQLVWYLSTRDDILWKRSVGPQWVHQFGRVPLGGSTPLDDDAYTTKPSNGRLVGGRLQISYESAELRDLFRFPAKALTCYGPTVARALAVRFADLCAFQNAAELSAFSPEYESVEGVPSLKLPITDEYSVRLVANHPKRKNDPVNWGIVKRIKVLAIVRRHE